jgi:hypothetical protein
LLNSSIRSFVKPQAVCAGLEEGLPSAPNAGVERRQPRDAEGISPKRGAMPMTPNVIVLSDGRSEARFGYVSGWFKGFWLS